jgi:hypothetical protein
VWPSVQSLGQERKRKQGKKEGSEEGREEKGGRKNKLDMILTFVKTQVLYVEYTFIVHTLLNK